MINTRTDLDAIAGTEAHFKFMKGLQGSIYRLEKDDELASWKVVEDTSTISRFGFTKADFPDATPPELPVYVAPEPEPTPVDPVAKLQAFLAANPDVVAIL